MTVSTATIIEATVADLIDSVVGESEAADIDLDLVSRDVPAGVIDVGDQARDGCVTVHDDDTVTVWAQGWPHTTQTVPGAWDHFVAKVEQ